MMPEGLAIDAVQGAEGITMQATRKARRDGWLAQYTF